MVKNPHYRRIGGTTAVGRDVKPRYGPLNGRLPARFKRLRVTVIGAGDVGARLVKQLSERFGTRIAILAVTRRVEQATRLRDLGARVLSLDLDERCALKRLRGFRQRVIQLAPPPATGLNDPRTRHLLSALGTSSPDYLNLRSTPGTQAAWVYASTTGVYGDVQGAFIDETRPVAPNSDRAKRRIKAEQLWRAAGQQGAARTVIIRVPGIYAGDRLPVERLQKGLPALHASEDVYTNHVNADDLANILWLAMLRGRTNRIYHAVDDSDLKMGDYFDQVADAMQLPRPPRKSRVDVARIVSPAMLSFMQESRRLSNQRLRQELRVRLRYPTVADTLSEAGRIRFGPE